MQRLENERQKIQVIQQWYIFQARKKSILYNHLKNRTPSQLYTFFDNIKLQWPIKDHQFKLWYIHTYFHDTRSNQIHWEMQFISSTNYIYCTPSMRHSTTVRFLTKSIFFFLAISVRPIVSALRHRRIVSHVLHSLVHLFQSTGSLLESLEVKLWWSISR